MNYWIIKSEPFKYAWEQLKADKQTFWDGVRNYQARNNLRAMEVGDLCCFYHSNKGLEIVGIAKVVTAAYPDPTIDDDRWVAVDVVPERDLKHPVTLKAMKANPELENMSLIRQGRLSVGPITPEEFDIIMRMSEEA